MKKTTAFLLLLLTVIAVQANPVSPSAARQTAQQFLAMKGLKVKNEAMCAPHRTMGGKQQCSPYYVFNATDGHGFVVVSGDDLTTPILGYALQGSFDAANIPSNLQWWLDEMGHQVTQIANLKAKVSRLQTHDDISPMVTALWNQGDATEEFSPFNPYNKLCPRQDGLLCVTGCMATALAQVLYYHKWPQEPMTDGLPAYNINNEWRKVGEANSVIILGLWSSKGEQNNLKQAVENGGISKVSQVEYINESILFGLLMKRTTRVYGE